MNNIPRGSFRAALACAVLLTACAAPVVPATPTPEPTPTVIPTATPVAIADLVSAANKTLAEGKFEDAERAYKDIVAARPETAAAWVGLARVYARRPDEGGRYPASLEAARKAVETAPSNADSLIALSSALLADGDAAGAIKAAESATGGSADAPSFAALAQAFLADAQFARALSATLKALELDPMAPEAWRALGYVRAHDGDHGRAAEAFAKAVSLRPEDPDYRVALAKQWLAMDRFDKAEAEAAAALSRNPAHIGALMALAAARGAQGFLSEAETVLKRAQALYPDSIQPVLTWARTHQDAATADEVLQKIRESLLRAPASQGLRQALAAVLISKQDCSAAEREAELLAADFPRDPQSLYLAGAAKSCKDDGAAALDRYRKALAIDSRYAPARLGMAFELRAQDRIDESEAELTLGLQTAPSKAFVHLVSASVTRRPSDAALDLEAALVANPRSLTALTRLAALYADMRQDAAAEQMANRALVVRPESAEARTILGQLRALAGEPAQAVRLLREALATDPESARAHRFLAYALLVDGKYQEAAAEQRIFESLVAQDDRPDAAQSQDSVRRSDLLASFPIAEQAMPALLAELSRRLENPAISLVAGPSRDRAGDGRVVTVTINFPKPATGAAADSREIGAAIAGIALIARAMPYADKGGAVVLQLAGRTTHIVRVTEDGARDVVMGIRPRYRFGSAVAVMHPVAPGDFPFADVVARLPRENQEYLKQVKPVETSSLDLGRLWQSRLYSASSAQARRAKTAFGVVNPLQEQGMGVLVNPVVLFAPDTRSLRYVRQAEVSAEDQFQMINELMYASDEVRAGGTILADLCAVDAGDACRAVFANYNASHAIIADRIMDGLDWYFLADHAQELEATLFRRAQASISDWLPGMEEPLAAMAIDQIERDIVRVQAGQTSTTRSFPSNTRQIMRQESWGGRSAAPQNLAPVDWIFAKLGSAWTDTGGDRLGLMGLRQLLSYNMGPILADLTVRDWYADSMAIAHKGDGPYVTIIRVNLEKDEYAARFAVMVRAAMEHRPDFVETTAELIGDPAAREWVSDNAVVIAHRDRQYVTLLLSTDHDAANEVAAALTTR